MYLLHGTFAGNDAAGVLTELGRFFPAVRRGLGKIAKVLVDAVMKDNGNYTIEYAREFEEALNADGGPTIPVRIFPWSGENHHLGRADAAVRLIDELATLDIAPERRILLWGHSHAGNILALLTNLVAGDEATVDSFFRAAECHYRIPWVNIVDIPIWQAVEQRLRSAARPIIKNPLDIATFGTPIRYGWDVQGYDKLIHFINHKPLPDIDPYFTTFPGTIDDIARASAGDYVQQFGIAGTNVPPFPLALRAWLADRRLNTLLQPEEYTSLNLTDRLRVGLRVPDAGETLLVDYGSPSGGISEHLAGHGVYTKLDWLPFHAAEMARRVCRAAAA
ncbi:MAG: hypothetical protein K8U03_18945 [Planctomycetia bacterium]|nr:hypothetical protein [Planctomycetia bacterium]